MDFDLIKPIKLPIAMLTYLGLWNSNLKWKRCYKVYGFVFQTIFSGLNVPTLWAGVFIANDIEELSQSLFLSSLEAAYIAKFINLLVYKKEVTEIIKTFQGVEFGLRTFDEIELFRKPQRAFNILQSTYIGSCLATAFPAIAMIFLSESALLLPAYIPFQLSERYHLSTSLFQFFGMFLTCATNIAIDMLQCYLLFHISLVFRLIAHRLENLARSDTSRPASDKGVFDKLRSIIQLQQVLVRITMKSEQFISCPVLVEVLLSSLILCFTGYELVNSPVQESPGIFAKNVHLLIVLGLQVYLPCFFAHEVTRQSEKLCHALYSSNWMDQPPKTRKIIYIYMETLKYPVYLKAGKFFDIGLPLFAKTVNYAYRFFALLVNMAK